MLVKLPLANNKRGREVHLEIGDRAHITEWDGIEVIGTIKEVTEEKLFIDRGKFLSGAYDCVDYSGYKNQTEFTFVLKELYEVKVADLAPITPLTLLSQAINQNYCGSKEIVMSPLFFKMYQEYMQEKCDSYCQYPIKIDSNLIGFTVYATPDEKTVKHNQSPSNCYTIDFFSHGKWQGSEIFSAFDNEVETKIEKSWANCKKRTGLTRAAFKLKCENKEVLRRAV